uniref:Ion transport domain-containing protein n=1 Tax=Chelonoidis abingdonii TaxID=106734 RepID=A0A8C0JCP3_CHEAB
TLSVGLFYSHGSHHALSWLSPGEGCSLSGGGGSFDSCSVISGVTVSPGSFHLPLQRLLWLFILGLFHIAFTMQLSSVYQPVYPEPKTNLSAASGDATLSTTIQDPIVIMVTLFFSLFGLVDPESLPSLTRTPQFTFVIIRFVFGVYLIVTLIVLINLLIAMMSDTYQRIQAQSDTEWKFGRAMLIRDMTRKSGTPSPFNLFTNLLYYIKILCKHKGTTANLYIDMCHRTFLLCSPRHVPEMGGEVIGINYMYLTYQLAQLCQKQNNKTSMGKSEDKSSL